ncbi:serine hydrolase domain-containing protein [Chitinophaga filiformis]|uniref:CubicO group peptidase, beta-lactamase class C family n=1 Tax=Chitinophaga filiformis TaxID=104663 RepID=A0A1G8C7P2_CHIFI|nr:serine hydrolase domain-containing protein [Chitinophaga filiformis]SDH41323.1 CubicO group peptidase, beta-lactamase class C family [Chitinophaga filiformis]
MKRFYLLLLLLGPTIFSAVGQSLVNLPNDSVLTALMQKHKVLALGVGVIENDALKTTKVFGELKSGVPAPNNTIFQVASLTKPIVEMTTLRLVSKGLWSLDEPLSKYWTDPDVENDPRNKLLTTRHVLSHQTGFVNWRWLHATGKLAFDFDPGTKTQYSGEGLEYLKHALEVKFKMPLTAIVEKYLFKPDGMKDTHFFWDGGVSEDRYAIPHNKEIKPYEIRKNKEASAADLLMTTVNDYTTFGLNVLKRKGLSDKVWQDMIHIQSKEPDARFGLGWEVFNNLKGKEFALVHGGSDPGVRTIIVLLPESKRGLVIFTNSDNGMPLIRDIIREALDIGGELLERAK